MKFKMVHENYNVADLGKSMAFYEKALGLHEVRRINGNGFIIVYMGNEENANSIWLLRQTTMKLPTSSTKKWAASVMRILQWVFTLLPIRTATGWRSCLTERNNSNIHLFVFRIKNVEIRKLKLPRHHKKEKEYGF